MANFFVVFEQTETPQKEFQGEQKKHGKEFELLEPAQGSAFVKVSAGTVKEAQEGVREKYAGQITTTPIVVTEAQWKSS